MRRFITLAFAVLAAASPAGQAATAGQSTPSGQPATAGQQAASPQAEEAAVIEQSRTAIRFENDGTARRETYFRVKAQSEAGVQQWGQVVLGYSAATEKLEIPFVRVRKADGSVVDTPGSTVQDLSSPVQRIAPVYTDFREKHVTVQSFRPGDTLEVNVVTTTHTALAAGHFWTEYTFNDQAIVLDEQLDIDVPATRPLILKVQPGFDPVIKEADGRRKYHWSHAHAVRADPKAAKDGKSAGKSSPEPVRASVRLTTFSDWKEVGAWFAGLERSARAPSAEVRDKARQLIAGRSTDLEKLEALYDFVSKNFRYVSLSLGAGRYQPRAAAEVLRDAYGDCKDKHTLLAALIDAAGLQASAALIDSDVKLDPDFPSPTQFDHVITRAIAGGQPVWLDATPEVAPFRLLSPNLRKKQALVADVVASRLEETPAEAPMTSIAATDVDGRIDLAGALSAVVKLTFRGDLELPIRTAFRLTPEPQWKTVVEGIVSQAGLQATLSDVRISDPQATAEAFSIAFKMDVPGFTKWEGAKPDLPMPLSMASDFADSPDADDTGPVTIPWVGQVSYMLKLELPAGIKVRAPVPVSVSRDYAEFRSTYSATGTTVTVERRLVTRQSELPDARRPDFIAFVNVLKDVARQRLSVESGAPAASSLPATPDAQIKELNQAGYDALRNRDYPRALSVLKRAVELSPADRTAWNNLGRAYMGLRDIPAAIAAYKKQIEINPFDAYAHNNLGLAYVAAGKFVEAEAAFLKQLEVNPLDKFTHGNLGRMYVAQRQYDKAAAALEKAVSISPDDATLQVQLGKAYANLRRTDEAAKTFDRAVDLAPNPGTWNDVAYELALAGTDLPRAQQYAESALAATSAAARNIDIENADVRALAVVGALASYWDTLGWVHFAKGDIGRAEKYVAAAWSLSQHAEVGDHLGQIYEKTGRRDAAVRQYALALAADRPPIEVRQHLARVAGGATRVEALVAEHRGDLSRMRTILLSGKGPAGKHADFFVLFAAPGRVEAVKFVEGDAEMRAVSAALQKIPANAVFPDETPAKILRRGIAACSPTGACSFTLLLPEDAKPVKQD
jgi:tetratricopeptide (TPR) repeat protein/transglutaminase-like putative cysteine protease